MDRKEAIRIVRMCCPKIANSKCDFETAMRVLVPELKESEDDRIRKAIRSLVLSVEPERLSILKITQSDCLAWLEKQDEQNPAWSERDENLLNLSLENLTELKNRFGEKYGKVGDCIHWLKSIKERVQP